MSALAIGHHAYICACVTTITCSYPNKLCFEKNDIQLELLLLFVITQLHSNNCVYVCTCTYVYTVYVYIVQNFGEGNLTDLPAIAIVLWHSM